MNQIVIFSFFPRIPWREVKVLFFSLTQLLQNNAYLQFIGRIIATKSTMCLVCALVLSYDSYQQKDWNTFFFKLTNISKSPFSVHTKWKTNIFRTVFGWIKRTRSPKHSSRTQTFLCFLLLDHFLHHCWFFSISGHIKNTILGGKKKKQILNLSFNNCTVGQVETMICFQCCLTRYPVRRGLAGWGERLDGGGYVLLSPSPGRFLSFQQGLRRSGLTLDMQRLRG